MMWLEVVKATRSQTAMGRVVRGKVGWRRRAPKDMVRGDGGEVVAPKPRSGDGLNVAEMKYCICPIEMSTSAERQVEVTSLVQVSLRTCDNQSRSDKCLNAADCCRYWYCICPIDMSTELRPRSDSCLNAARICDLIMAYTYYQWGD
jgi:hypothetical protein